MPSCPRTLPGSVFRRPACVALGEAMLLAARRLTSGGVWVRASRNVESSSSSSSHQRRATRVPAAPAGLRRSVVRRFSAGSGGSGGKPAAPARRPGAEESMTKAEMERVVQKAKDEERWMNVLMPERNWGITSPVTWVMFGCICALFV